MVKKGLLIIENGTKDCSEKSQLQYFEEKSVLVSPPTLFLSFEMPFSTCVEIYGRL